MNNISRYGGSGGNGIHNQQQQLQQQQQQSSQSNHLGVNKIGKNIKKSPIHQPNFGRQQDHHQLLQQQQSQNPPQPQPQVYNINKSDFRSVVQRLTGTPSRDPSPNRASTPPPPRPAANPPKPASMRMQRIRPPPLTPITRAAPVPIQHPHQFHNQHPHPNPNANLNPALIPRPTPPPSQALPPAQAPLPAFSPAFPPTPPFWPGVAESPVSAYMRYLENSVLNPGQMPPGQAQMRPQAQQGNHGPPGHQHMQQPQPYPGLLPTPPAPGGVPYHMGAGPSMPLNNSLPSPLPSPTAFLNLLSPRSPYPLLSPRFQTSTPMTPTFMLSPLPQAGSILGPGPQPPPSPGLFFPPSPSWFIPSPRWRDM